MLGVGGRVARWCIPRLLFFSFFFSFLFSFFFFFNDTATTEIYTLSLHDALPICRRWQGNRNPFVDFPELALALHYEPYTLPAVGERRIYEECEKIPTLAPTMAFNICDRVRIGRAHV